MPSAYRFIKPSQICGGFSIARIARNLGDSAQGIGNGFEASLPLAGISCLRRNNQ